MELREVPDPLPAAGEARLRVDAVGLCGSDHHVWTGEANYATDARGAPVPLERAPQLLGHEIVATVERAGPDCALREGQEVVVDQGVNCASRGRARGAWCPYCADGHSHQCAEYAEHGITGLPGGLAEYVCVPAVNCVPRDPALPARHAALTEPLACVLHACAAAAAASDARFALAAPAPAARVRSVLLCGAGTAGLLFVQVLRRVLGYDGLLLVSEPDPRKRALAVAFGAEALDPDDCDPADAARERSGGGVEWLIEASGSAQALAAAPRAIRKQATVLLYGFGHGGGSLEALNPLHWKEPRMVMPTGASGALDADGRPALYARALGLLERGEVRVDRIVDEVLPGLDGVPAAFARWGAGGVIKTVMEAR